MSILHRNVMVLMTRDSLEDLPEWPLPAGFSACWYRPGDEQAWIDIHRLAEQHVETSEEVYRREFGADPVPLGQRQLFLRDQRQMPIATATAWGDDQYDGQDSGRLHWVAMIPEYQGRGLAKPLVSLVLRRLWDLGHRRAYLRTSTARVPAISLYLKAGFRPALPTPQDREAWGELEPHLKYRLEA